MRKLEEYIRVSDEVATALHEGKPVLALESTIISHGMPYPKNVETALMVERTVRENGAVPATVCVIGGKIVVGATEADIEHLGKTGAGIAKASRRDLPVLISKKLDGATTVATTMIGASLAGVRVFATGGVGGVHRGAQTTMDISADLEELAKTDVIVVCAGCKSILDLPLTLEYLETRGVPVIGYGTSELPAFYTDKSGLGVDYRLDSPDEIADAFAAKQGLGLKGGMLVANPIPSEYAMNPDDINGTIESAVKDAERLGIHGKALTPYLLARIQELTGGRSLEANIQLVLNNARLGARIAAAVSERG